MGRVAARGHPNGIDRDPSKFKRFCDIRNPTPNEFIGSRAAIITNVPYQLETPSMGKAMKLPLKQTRFGGKSNWVRCNVVSPVCSRRPANEPTALSLQTRFV